MSTVRIRRPERIDAEIKLPGDKSISQRALLLSAIGEGRARVRNLGGGADVAAMRDCLLELGVEIDGDTVIGKGFEGLRPPRGPLDCRNSGATMRMLAGVLAGRPFRVELVGDASLSRRPMDRIVEPLAQMGADASWPPLTVGGGRPLEGVRHDLPVASAQVKSCLLLAGLQAGGITSVTEPSPTRNHTELMLAAMGAPLGTDGPAITIRRPDQPLRPFDMDVPGDISAASFWLVVAALHPAARVSLSAVGVNPTRTALLALLRHHAGLRLEVANWHMQGSEPAADLVAIGGGGELRPMQVWGDLTAALIDEIPVLAVAAAVLPGTSEIRDARELRVKESDRIKTMAAALGAMGAAVEELEDGLRIRGGAGLEGMPVDSQGDHRVAMAMAVAGMLAEGVTEIEGADAAAVSDPGFWDELARIGAVA